MVSFRGTQFPTSPSTTLKWTIQLLQANLRASVDISEYRYWSGDGVVLSFSRTIPLASDLAFLLAFSLPYRLSKSFLQLQWTAPINNLLINGAWFRRSAVTLHRRK